MKKQYIEKKTNRDKKHTQLIRGIIYAIIIIIIYNMLIISISAILNKTGKSIFGYNMYIITTDSMKPNINSGDIIIINKADKENLKVGDVITFSQPEGLITHRIVKIEEDEYITKGDNNNIEDEKKVKYEQIKGRKVMKIPFLGKVVILLQDEVYIIVIIIIVLLIYLNVQTREEKDRIRREKKERADDKFQKNN